MIIITISLWPRHTGLGPDRRQPCLTHRCSAFKPWLAITQRWCLDKNIGVSAILNYTISLMKNDRKKKKFHCQVHLADITGCAPSLRNQDGIKKYTTGSICSNHDLNGNQKTAKFQPWPFRNNVNRKKIQNERKTP